ncbi:hypothetical protein V5799_003428 [Amblyomma americanum]|uniref:Alpha-1,4-N-acetylglucosaminyltransferase n=1 Tax=Amblyomma americanum TaxID=6943 RepID=A0AAQ4D901_AMBAM
MEPPELRARRPRSFYDADGSTGYAHDIVPNIIHIVRYNQTELSMMDVVFLRSMFLNHRPDTIMVHCSPCGFTGPFVNWTEGINFTFVPYHFPREVFGRKIEVIHHSADVARIRILMQYGGIYLDRDVFVVKSLRRFLRYEATIAVPPKAYLGNNLMIFHKDSRFLKLYLETYREFNDSRWYYNAGELPTVQLFHKHPHLANRVYYGLEINLDMLHMMYEPHSYPDWRDAYAMHTFIFHRGESPYDPLHNGDFNQTNIRDLDNAIGQMTRSVLFGTSDFVGPDVPVLSVTELASRKNNGEDLTRMTPGNAKPFYGK